MMGIWLKSAMLLPLLVATSCSEINRSSSVGQVDTTSSYIAASPDSSIKAATGRPIFGYRFVITGDFDGNGTTDTLQEHYVRQSSNEEIPKGIAGFDYDALAERAYRENPRCYIASTGTIRDTLFVGDGTLGVAFLRNEGDLDGNGTDEISYVIDQPDWSSINHCSVMTLKATGWEKLFWFEIREWQLPSLPGQNKSYGLFGIEEAQYFNESSALDSINEVELRKFSFIKKVKSGVVQIETYAQENTDSTVKGDPMTMVVNLKR
jgi:hypothetical protein